MEKIREFEFEKGEIIFKNYEIIKCLGRGHEGEVYLVNEISTGIERAAKFFYPHVNKYGKLSKYYAKKLHKLRYCDIIVQYYSQNEFYYKSQPVVLLLSEFIDGELLSDYLKHLSGKKLDPFMATQLLYELALGLEEIHNLREYHGDLHTGNIIIQRKGLKFNPKLFDIYHWGVGKDLHLQQDVIKLIHLYYELLGGKERYNKLPKEVRDICCGLKKSLILKKFKTMTKLREYLENITWS